MPSTLPILVSGRSDPINVPCELSDSFTFTAYLPSRGLREFTAWLTSIDPREAEIADVTLGMPEKLAHAVGGAYDLDDDEQHRADEAASDALWNMLCAVGLNPVTRQGVNTAREPAALALIALAHEAECKAWEALRAAHGAMGGTAYDFYEANPASDELAGPQWASKAARMLETYVTRCLDEALLAQRIKAEKQQAERGGDEAAPGSECSGAPR